MLIRRRSRPVQEPTPTETQSEPEVAAPQTQVQQLVFRHRQTSGNTPAHKAARTDVARAQINEQLKLIANAEHAIDEAQAAINAAHERVDQLMRSVNLSEHTNGVHVATIEEQFSRQQRTIDPQKFRNSVPNDVFWKSLSISIEKAKDHLSDKEFNRIATVIPGKSMGYTLKINRVKVKKRAA